LRSSYGGDHLLVSRGLNWRECLVAQLAQDVVGAAAELARDGEAGAVVVDPPRNLPVVRVIGRAGAARLLGRFEQRPAQQLRPFVREVTGSAIEVVPDNLSLMTQLGAVRLAE
jgi:hypothetical protein